jgi:hypothetical protein
MTITITTDTEQEIVADVLERLGIKFMPGFGGKGIYPEFFFGTGIDVDARRIRFVEREVRHMLANLAEFLPALVEDLEPPPS